MAAKSFAAILKRFDGAHRLEMRCIDCALERFQCNRTSGAIALARAVGSMPVVVLMKVRHRKPARIRAEIVAYR